MPPPRETDPALRQQRRSAALLRYRLRQKRARSDGDLSNGSDSQIVEGTGAGEVSTKSRPSAADRAPDGPRRYLEVWLEDEAAVELRLEQGMSWDDVAVVAAAAFDVPVHSIYLVAHTDVWTGRIVGGPSEAAVCEFVLARRRVVV